MSRTPLTLYVAAFLASAAAGASVPSREAASLQYANLPISFEVNAGQADSAVKFLARGHYGSLLLTPGDAWLTLQHPAGANPSGVLRLKLAGANSNPTLEGMDKLPGTANYFTGTDSSLWRTNVGTFARVKYHDVYPGVDLIYYGNQQKLEYDLVVQPGADPGAVRLEFGGAEKITLEAGGDLLLQLKGETIRQHKPIVYQEIGGERKMLSGEYVLRQGMQVGFQLAEYDKTQSLIIDPVLAYSATFGGSGINQALGVAAGGDGSIYITGNTTSRTFPGVNAFQTNFLGNLDAFVMKIGTNGAVAYATYLGGGPANTLNNASYGQGIAVDGAGDAFVTGYTQVTNFPTQNPLQGTIGGSFDAFVTELNPTGSGLVFSTYLGGSGFDAANGIALDGEGNVIITGHTQSANFPTHNAAQPAYGGGGDAFVTKLNTNGSALVYSTFLGGADSEDDVSKSQNTVLIFAQNNVGGAVAADLEGNAYVTGWTYSSNFPVMNAFQRTNIVYGQGFYANAFVTRYDASGNIRSSTYFGSQFGAFGRAIGVDFNGNVYFAGSSYGGGLPTTNAAQPVYGGNGAATIGDGFVAAFDATGTNLLYCTYLGGGGDDQVNGIAVRDDGAVAVTGFTDSPNFPLLNAVQTNGYQGFFNSPDAAGHWSLSNSGLLSASIWSVQIDPAHPSTLYALTSTGCFKSTDGGAHWLLANSGISLLFGNSDPSEAGMLAIDPVHPSTLYACGFAGIYKTTNGAANWTLSSIPGAYGLQTVVVDSMTPTTLYAGDSSLGVLKSLDAGNSWNTMTNGLNNFSINSLLVDPQNSASVYAGVNNSAGVSLFKSINGGANWTVLGGGLPNGPIAFLAFNPAASSTVYAIVNTVAGPVLCVSSNAGAIWTETFSASGFKLTALAVGPGSGSSASPAITIAQSGSDDVLSWPASFTNFTPQFAPSLQPATWTNLSQSAGVANGSNVITNRPSGAQGYYRLAGTNNTPSSQSLYLGTDAASGVGIYKSTDAGNSWNVAGPFAGDTISVLTVNPASPGVVYAALNGGRDAFLSSYATNGQLFSSTYLGGSGADQGNGVALLKDSDVAVTGSSFSSDFPIVASNLREHPLSGSTTPATTGVADFVTVMSYVEPCKTDGSFERTFHVGEVISDWPLGYYADILPDDSQLPAGLHVNATAIHNPQLVGTAGGSNNMTGTWTFTVTYFGEVPCPDYSIVYTVHIVSP